MPYIPPEVVAKAKEMDLLTYLQNFEPQELVHFGGNTYCTREHDSLKISNGKWYWFSRSIGGRSALDYLIKVKELSFLEAVELLAGPSAVTPIVRPAAPKPPAPKVLLLPKANDNCDRVRSYLVGRGIDAELIDFCISTGRLYESASHHNAVFVGHDCQGKPRYANLRGTGSSFKGECNGSDKRYSFHISAQGNSTLHLFESAIDLMSYVTLRKLHGLPLWNDHLLSLAGVYKPRKALQESSLPLALSQYLEDHPGIQRIVLRLDQDYAGREASHALQELLKDRYTILLKPPPQGKDFNDYLCIRLGMGTAKEKEFQGRT